MKRQAINTETSLRVRNERGNLFEEIASYLAMTNYSLVAVHYSLINLTSQY